MVEIREAKEGLDVPHLAWFGPVANSGDFVLCVTNRFSNLWAIIHPPLSTKQGVQHVRHVRWCAPSSIKIL